MKTKTTVNWKKRFLIPGAITAFALVAAPVVMYDVTGDMGGAISTAYADEGESKGKAYRGKRDGYQPSPGRSNPTRNFGQISLAVYPGRIYLLHLGGDLFLPNPFYHLPGATVSA